MKKQYEYYRNKYLIGIYRCESDNDELVALCNNDKEFSEFMNITLNNARVILKNFFDKKSHHFRYFGKLCEIYFIDKINVE